jgi:transcriptional regulator with XRE-family HTH domain
MQAFSPMTLRKTRLDAGLSQSELARRAACDRWAVMRTESGTQTPTAPLLCRLADALDLPIEAFFVRA